MGDPTDLVHLRFHDGYTDGLAGVLFRDGRSVAPLYRYRAEKLVVQAGAPMRIEELPIETPPPPAPAVVASEPEDSPLRAPTRRLKRAP